MVSIEFTLFEVNRFKAKYLYSFSSLADGEPGLRFLFRMRHLAATKLSRKPETAQAGCLKTISDLKLKDLDRIKFEPQNEDWKPLSD